MNLKTNYKQIYHVLTYTYQNKINFCTFKFKINCLDLQPAICFGSMVLFRQIHAFDKSKYPIIKCRYSNINNTKCIHFDFI